MMFTDVTDQTLREARPGIELVEEVLLDSEFPIYLYGLTTKDTVLLAAGASLGMDDAGGGLAEVGIAFPCRKEALSQLYGSGFILTDQDFAYLLGSDGVRTTQFSGQRPPKITAMDFTRMALADSDAWLDEFLAQYGKSTPVAATVSRGQEPAIKTSTFSRPRNSIDDFLSR